MTKITLWDARAPDPGLGKKSGWTRGSGQAKPLNMRGIKGVLGHGGVALWIAILFLSGCAPSCVTESSLEDESAGAASDAQDVESTKVPEQAPRGARPLVVPGEDLAITPELLAAFLTCERTSLRASTTEGRARMAADCGFPNLEQFDAFAARVDAMRNWRLEMRTHESMIRAREQTESKLDQLVSEGGMTKEQRDMTLSFFPSLSPPDLPDLSPPIQEAEVRAIEEVNLRQLSSGSRRHR